MNLDWINFSVALNIDTGVLLTFTQLNIGQILIILRIELVLLVEQSLDRLSIFLSSTESIVPIEVTHIRCHGIVTHKVRIILLSGVRVGRPTSDSVSLAQIINLVLHCAYSVEVFTLTPALSNDVVFNAVDVVSQCFEPIVEGFVLDSELFQHFGFLAV
jgi:hypothetical protein